MLLNDFFNSWIGGKSPTLPVVESNSGIQRPTVIVPNSERNGRESKECSVNAEEWIAPPLVRCATVRTVTYTDLRSLSFAAFSTAIERFPNAEEAIRRRVHVRRRELLQTAQEVDRFNPKLKKNFARQKRRQKKHYASSSRRYSAAPKRRVSSSRKTADSPSPRWFVAPGEESETTCGESEGGASSNVTDEEDGCRDGDTRAFRSGSTESEQGFKWMQSMPVSSPPPY